MCVCVCVCVCARACVYKCLCVCVGGMCYSDNTRRYMHVRLQTWCLNSILLALPHDNCLNHAGIFGQTYCGFRTVPSSDSVGRLVCIYNSILMKVEAS